MRKSSSSKLRVLGFCVALLLGFQGCSLITPFVLPVVDIPPPPVLEVCPAIPQLQGRIVELEDGSQSVLLTMELAKELSAYMRGYRACAEGNQVELEGYIQKLVNRLEIVKGGVK